MNKLQKLIGKTKQRVIDRVMGNSPAPAETLPEAERYRAEGIEALIRQAAAEACVLLKNDGVLPLRPGQALAVFGRCQLDGFPVGYGSGGNIRAPYVRSLIDGLEASGLALDRPLLLRYRSWAAQPGNEADKGWWGHWPFHYPEMPLDDAAVQRAARNADTALVVIGRAAGEDRDNTLTPGSYYLTEEERAMLDKVCATFEKTVVVLNIGNVIDLSWAEAYGDRLSALLILWQGGMESGNAAADVLTGRVSPSGRLADSIARRYEDYPASAHFGDPKANDYAEGVFVGYRYFDAFAENRLLYPFGFGLSYTRFETEPLGLTREAGGVTLRVRVRNVGERPGKEVVQLWCRAPRGELEKPPRVLCAFAKTKTLSPGEEQLLTLACGERDFASYDETRHAFVLEAGDYRFLVGEQDAGGFTLDETLVLESCEPIVLDSAALRARILERLPAASGDVPAPDASLDDVRAGRVSLGSFLAGLSLEELESLTRGEGRLNSPLGVSGNTGVFGGVLASLRARGVRPLVTADGPAGLRLNRFSSLIPIGTALACTWNTELVEALHRKIGEEMTHYGVDIHLAPGMNLHRDPLCGRNFEYYSEDPLLSGKMAAAAVRGVQSTGHASCPKHFACNNQEFRRNRNDSRVSERALRELYLRGFEICVREAKPLCLMTSYNKVNGVWSHYHYDLATTVLRREWGFEGVTMTDWWMQAAQSPEFPALRNNAYRVRAGVDVLMPGDMRHIARRYRADSTLLESFGKPEGITRGELERSAGRVLSLILRLYP